MAITCDVLVVGGGPAGMTAASILSNNGISTIVLEKNITLGPEYSKYDITEGNRIQGILDKIGIKPNKISSTSEWFSPNHNFILDSDIQDYYFKRGSNEDSIENMLLNKLNDNNVDVYFKSKINSIDKNKTKIKTAKIKTVKVDKNNEKLEIEPDFVIGADGPHSDLRNMLNIKTRILTQFNGFGVLMESEQNDAIPHAKIYFNKEIAPGGYIYSGSVGKDVFYCAVTDDIFRKKEKLEKN